MTSPDAFDALAAALRSPDTAERIEAIKAVGKGRDPRAIGLLVRELWDPPMQSYALDALLEIGDPACIGDIIYCMLKNDESAEKARTILNGFCAHAIGPLVDHIAHRGVAEDCCRAIATLIDIKGCETIRGFWKP